MRKKDMRYPLHAGVILLLLFNVAAAKSGDDKIPTFHKSFSRRELLETFAVNHLDNVPKYAPTKINGLQKLKQDDYFMPLSLRAFGKDFHFKVSSNNGAVGDTHTVEFVGENGKITKYSGVMGDFSVGTVDNDPISSVSLYHTGKGVSGSIHTAGDFYILNPLPHRLKSKDVDHVIYSVSDMSGEHFLRNYTAKRDEMTKDAKRPQRSRRSVNHVVKKTAEIMIAADYKMLEYFSKDVLPSYMLAMANIVAGFFRDPTLAYPLDIVVMRSTIFETDIFKAENVGALLSNFSKWTKENNDMDDTKEDHVDAAVLLTRNGCANGCQLEGLALYNTMCSSNAQAVIKDRGLMTAIIVSHELGHVLGASHDGNGNPCADGLNIMASGSPQGGAPAIRWSTCSSERIATALKSPRSHCFDDLPPIKPITDSTFQLYGTIYNANKQCEFIFGTKYQMCAPYQHHCSSLFCNEIGTMTCTAIPYPAVHGTECAPYKWCIDGACVPDGRTPDPPIHGGWSAWSEYDACTKSCGTGVQWRVRHCNNPAPAHGGAWCDKTAIRKVPEHGHHRTCNTQPCETKSTSHLPIDLVERDQQCNKKRPGSFFCSTCGGAGPCELVCGESRYSGSLLGHVMSGTGCKTIGIPEGRGICVQGICTEIGCDKKIESGVELDRCGVCGGNGDSCHRFTGMNNETYDQLGLYYVMTIPRNTTNAEVKEVAATKSFLGFKVGPATNFAINLPTQSVTINIENVKVDYEMRAFDYADKLVFTALNPTSALKEDVYVYFCNFYQSPSKGLVWDVLVDGHSQNDTLDVHWITDPWSICSKPCAGGKQYRKIYCQRKDDNSRVSNEACTSMNGTKPPKEQECNKQDCPPRWYISEWSKCSKTCASGIRTRSIICGKYTSSGTFLKIGDAECPDPKPSVATNESCNTMTCPAHWHILSAFSPCSQSCGGGISTREIGCRRTNETGYNVVVSDLECTNIFRPITAESCNEDVPCPLWRIVYSQCSATCGAGVQRPDVICSEVDKINPLPFVKCNQTEKPDISSISLKECNLGICQGFKWGIKDGQCSVTCGTGLLPVVLYCYDIATLVQVDAFRCDAANKPTIPPPKECYSGICKEEVIWKNDRFTSCTKTCGKGTQSSIPYCVQMKDDVQVPSIRCDAGSKPAIVTKACAINPCPAYDWVMNYGDCSVSCGEGLEIGAAVCKNISTSTVVNDSFCVAEEKPATNLKKCNLGDCPDPTSFHWKVREMQCTVTCGSGIISTEIICLRKDGDRKLTMVDPKNCEKELQPQVKPKACVLEDCPPTHKWNILQSHCGTGCGKRYDTLEVECVNLIKNGTDDHKLCGKLVEKTPKCTHDDCKPVYQDSNTLFYALGCFFDTLWNRRVPHYYASYRGEFQITNPKPVIMRCLNAAIEKKNTFFSLQFFGECWMGGDSVLNTYDKDGVTNRCVGGSGEGGVNFVYHIGSPIAPSVLPPILKLGCLVNDKDRFGMEKFNTFSLKELFEWDQERLGKIVSNCAHIAHESKNPIFGGDNTGKCLKQEEIVASMKIGKISKTCFPASSCVKQYYMFTFV